MLPSSSSARVGSIPYLRLKHLEKWEIFTTETPVALSVPSETAKGHVSYVTFITPECYEAIQDYLNYRKRYGENINSETPIVRDTFEAKPDGSINPQPLSYNGLKTVYGRMARRFLRTEKKKRHEFKTTHGFRKFFRTALDSAGVPAGASAALMGHSAGLVSIYTKHTLEELRNEYTKALPYLTIEKQTVETEIERRKQNIRDTAKLLGLSLEKLNRLEELIAKAKTTEEVDIALKNLEKTEDCQKVVNELELETWLAKGWKVVAVLPSGKVVVDNK